MLEEQLFQKAKKQRNYSKSMQRRLREITLQGAIEKCPILLYGKIND